MIVFCISAFFAGISGVLFAFTVHFGVDRHPFHVVLLADLAVPPALSPFAEPWCGIFGLVAAVIPGYLTSANVTYWLNAFFGVSAISVAMQGGHLGMPLKCGAS